VVVGFDLSVEELDRRRHGRGAASFLCFRQNAPRVRGVAYDTLLAGQAARRLATICALDSRHDDVVVGFDLSVEELDRRRHGRGAASFLLDWAVVGPRLKRKRELRPAAKGDQGQARTARSRTFAR
jgi:hypothetical protein